jgi:hypothetical protein
MDESDCAQQMHQLIVDELAGIYTADERIEVFSLFISIATSHHEAIIVLARHDRLVGSAFALLRSLVEAVYRGLFTAFRATPAQINAIRDGGEPYGHFNPLADSLDGIFKTDGLFAQFGGETWRSLNGYTHGGLEQLRNRINDDGAVGSHYTPESVKRLLNSSTSLFTMFAIPFLRAVGKVQSAEIVGQRYVALYPIPSSQHG